MPIIGMKIRRTLRLRGLPLAFVLAAVHLSAQITPQPAPPAAPQIWTWDNVKDRFQTNNPTLLAGF